MPSGLKTAEEVSASCHCSPNRLRELADAGLIPHYRIEDGEPLFVQAEARRWLAQNALTRVNGVEMLPSPRVVSFAPPADMRDAPPQLRHLEGLRGLELEVQPGIYFLCDGDEVVYVGQSRSPRGRIAQHVIDGKRFTRVFLMPCPESELDVQEALYIHALRPALNGTHKTGEKVAQRSIKQLAAIGVSHEHILTRIKEHARLTESPVSA